MNEKTLKHLETKKEGLFTEKQTSIFLSSKLWEIGSNLGPKQKLYSMLCVRSTEFIVREFFEGIILFYEVVRFFVCSKGSCYPLDRYCSPLQ